jgi:hypothetical protein
MMHLAFFSGSDAGIGFLEQLDVGTGSSNMYFHCLWNIKKVPSLNREKTTENVYCFS